MDDDHFNRDDDKEDDEDDIDTAGPGVEMSDASKETRDVKHFCKYMDKATDLRLCFVCHEEHSALFIKNKIYDSSDTLFDPLRPTPDSPPVLAFDEDFAVEADIAFRVCCRCVKILKSKKVPPRSSKNFHLLTDETFMKFFRNLDRYQRRLIAKINPIMTMNTQKVFLQFPFFTISIFCHHFLNSIMCLALLVIY